MGNTPSSDRDSPEAIIENLEDFSGDDVIRYVIENTESFMEATGGLEDEEEDEQSKKRRRIRGLTAEEWQNTSWGKMLRNEAIRDISTVEGKEFRRRYRLPAPFFLDYLVPECQRLNLFESKVKENGELMGHIPIAIKVLIALRMLARGNVVDDLVEMSEASSFIVRHCFKTFILNFAREFKDAFITMPTGEELEKIMAIYARLGFPGALGSMDCTHVRWLVCPRNLTNLCTGKEAFPTLSFQVVVDHARKIHHVSVSGFGSMNDINMCTVDVIVKDDDKGLLDTSGQTRNLYKEVEFTVLDDYGQPTTIRGAYLITDGGYEPLSIFVNPNVGRSDRGSIVWSEFLEAIRKDVECTFGILKNRFHILRGIKFPEQEIVDAAFVSCCILHNMLLEIDGYDISAWELDVAWERVDMSPVWDLPVDLDDAPVVEDVFVNDEGPPIEPFEGVEFAEVVQDNGVVELSPRREPVVRVLTIPLRQPSKLRDLLVKHFSCQYRLGRVQWPKNMRRTDRLLLGRSAPVKTPAAIMRALSIVRETLYVKNSDLRLMMGEDVIDLIGLGLFSSIPVRKDEVISHFIGEFVTHAERLRRKRVSGKEEYTIRYNHRYYYDCSPFLEVCKLSRANDPSECFNIKTRAEAIANAYLSIDLIGKRLCLKALIDIPPNQEIAWVYGDLPH